MNLTFRGMGPLQKNTSPESSAIVTKPRCPAYSIKLNFFGLKMSGAISKRRAFFGASDVGPIPLVRRRLDVVGSQPVASVVAVDAAQERDVVVVVATREVGQQFEPREPKVE